MMWIVLSHELVFSGLSWPTLVKPFWLDVGNISLSRKNRHTVYIAEGVAARLQHTSPATAKN